MQVVRISGPDDLRIVEFRDLADHDRLRARGLFIAEGRIVVERLIEDALGKDQRFGVRSLLLNAAAWRALEPHCAHLAADVTAFVCETQDFEQLTGYNFHRGCLALASRPSPVALEELVANSRTLVVLEEVANVDNVGSIFRNASAFGADGIVLSAGCGDPLYRKAIRTSMAATLRVPFVVAEAGDGWHAALVRLRERGFQIVALTLRGRVLDLETFARSRRPDRLALLVGTEGAGLSAAAEAAADVHVHIPIREDVDSLNVSVATGIALHRLLLPTTG
jgi:tRNA G18 (ribose-2'-O)-methylase SpoU